MALSFQIHACLSVLAPSWAPELPPPTPLAGPAPILFQGLQRRVGRIRTQIMESDLGWDPGTLNVDSHTTYSGPQSPNLSDGWSNNYPLGLTQSLKQNQNKKKHYKLERWISS